MQTFSPSHIEILDSKEILNIENGQCLKVVKETQCFFVIRAFDGVEFQVSKKTKRINGFSNGGFIRTSRQPLVNI